MVTLCSTSSNNSIKAASKDSLNSQDWIPSSRGVGFKKGGLSHVSNKKMNVKKSSFLNCTNFQKNAHQF